MGNNEPCQATQGGGTWCGLLFRIASSLHDVRPSGFSQHRCEQYQRLRVFRPAREAKVQLAASMLEGEMLGKSVK